jgi:hypothetical protein
MAEELTIKAPTPNTVAEAAQAAADAYAPEEVEKHAQAIADAWESKLKEQTRIYQKRFTEASKPEAAGPITLHPQPYQWWNLLMAGPFQQVAPLGPFLPSKIIRIGEPAFMVFALWRNPGPIPGGPNPSAAQIMSPFQFSVWGETINLSTVQNGPDLGPITGTFGGGFINIFTSLIPAGFFPAPPDGKPYLFEMNGTVDIIGPGVGLPPFAGFSTWVLDPDSELPFAIPFLPGVGPVFVPGVGPRLQHDTPARFLVYR